MDLLRGLLCLGLAAGFGTPAQAVTAETAWAAMQGQVGALGLSLDASILRRSGAALHVTGVFLGPGTPSEAGYPRALIPEIVLTEAGDGSVTIALPARIEVVVGDHDRRVVLTQRGLDLTLHDAQGGGRTEFAAGQIKAVIGFEGPVELPDGSFALARFRFATALDGPRGMIETLPNKDLPQRLHLTADTLRAEVNAIDPTLGETVQMAVRLEQVITTLSVGLPSDGAGAAQMPGADLEFGAARAVGTALLSTRVPETTDETDFDSEAVMIRAGVRLPRFLLEEPFEDDPAMAMAMAMLAAALGLGGRVHLSLETGAGTATNRTVGTFPSLATTQVSSSGRVALRLDKTALVAEVVQGAGQTIVQLIDTALPEARISHGPITMRGSMTTLPSPVPGGVEFMLDLRDVRLNDEVWDFFDGKKAVPREPLAVRLDFGIVGDIGLDLASMLGLEPAPEFSFDMDRIDLRGFLLAAGGAMFSGQGAFTFDAARVDADGVRIPVGTADLTLTGADRLIDAVQSVGLVPAETIAQLREGLRWAWPDPGAQDVRKAVFELLPDGSAALNGRVLE